MEFQPDRSDRLSGAKPGSGPCEKAGMVFCGECDCPGLADPDNLFDDQCYGDLLRDLQPRFAGSLNHTAVPGGG